jgi:hypothetical protein
MSSEEERLTWKIKHKVNKVKKKELMVSNWFNVLDAFLCFTRWKREGVE